MHQYGLWCAADLGPCGKFVLAFEFREKCGVKNYPKGSNQGSQRKILLLGFVFKCRARRNHIHPPEDDDVLLPAAVIGTAAGPGAHEWRTGIYFSWTGKFPLPKLSWKSENFHPPENLENTVYFGVFSKFGF